jgi:hypothetical protein
MKNTTSIKQHFYSFLLFFTIACATKNQQKEGVDTTAVADEYPTYDIAGDYKVRTLYENDSLILENLVAAEAAGIDYHIIVSSIDNKTGSIKQDWRGPNNDSVRVNNGSIVKIKLTPKQNVTEFEEIWEKGSMIMSGSFENDLLHLIQKDKDSGKIIAKIIAQKQ